MSGTRPWRWKPHICDPVRPKPGWTSSAMKRPPARADGGGGGREEPGGIGQDAVGGEDRVDDQGAGLRP